MIVARVAKRAAQCAAVGALVVLGLALFVARGGSVDLARFARPDDAVVVADRHGDVLRVLRARGVDRRWIPLREISPHLIAAILATEDAHFQTHHGVDVPALFRAVADNTIPWRRRSGASTLTEQLVKLVYGRHGPRPLAKFVEVARAVALERVMSKDEILEQYLNRLPFPDGVEGIERASEVYFGRRASGLSVAQAAMLAGLPQGPSRYDPRRHAVAALGRRNVVLARMVATGALAPSDLESAIREPLGLTDVVAHRYEAPRFVERAMDELREGHGPSPAEGVIATTLDLPLQGDAERIVGAVVERLGSRGVRNGAALVVANTTGEILAYVGAAHAEGDGDPADDGRALDLLRARRAPGSTLKPFVYELLFERGGTPATVLDDIPWSMTGAHGVSFEPRDYDGHARGPVRARAALAASLNLAALDAARRVGPDAIVARLDALGLDLPGDALTYGPAIVLGGTSVRPVDLARAYVTLARFGTSVRLSSRAGESGDPRRVMPPEAAALTWDVLSDPVARANGFGRDLRDLAEGRPFALKTGTSQGSRDAWTVVANDRVTVLVWLGDPSGTPMASVSGFDAAAPAAVALFARADARASDDGITPFVRPTVSMDTVEVCAFSGLRAGPGCHHTVHEHFVGHTAPSEVCAAHDRAGHDVLPARYAAWQQRVQSQGVVVADRDARAVSPDDTVVIRTPRDGARIVIDATRSDALVPLRATDGHGAVVPVTWTVDDQPTDPAWHPTLGHHVLAARWGTRGSAPVSVEVVGVRRDQTVGTSGQLASAPRPVSRER